MSATFTADELAAYPGVSASAETIAMVTELINDIVSETIVATGVSAPAKPAKVRALALAAAAEPLRNPMGATTISIQMDDYKETQVLPDGSVTRGQNGIGFSGDQMGALVGFITGTTPAHKSISLVVPGVTDACSGYGAARGWLPA